MCVSSMLVALLFALPFSTFAGQEPEISGTYRSAEQEDSSTLQLRADGSFLYQDRAGNCFLWHDLEGKWSTDGDILTLSWVQEWIDDSSGIRCLPPSGESSSIRIEVLDSKKRPIAGAVVTINRRSPGVATDSAGIALASLRAEPFHPADADLPIEWIDVEINRNADSGHRSLSQVIDCPDTRSFSVVFDLNPQPRVERMTQTFHVDDGVLSLIGSLDSSSEAPQLFAKRLAKVSEAK